MIYKLQDQVDRSKVIPEERGGKPADKPGSVVGNHSSGTVVTDGLKQPTRKQREPRLLLPYLVLPQMRFAMPSTVTGNAVGSYSTISPLPVLADFGGIFLLHCLSPWVVLPRLITPGR